MFSVGSIGAIGRGSYASIDPLWRIAGIAPRLDLRFAQNRSLVDAVSGQNLITFTRASGGTYIDNTGQLQTAANNEPRFSHNPITGESLGLMIEDQQTNLLLNSGTLSTQNVAVTAVAHTLHFTGTGTITLSGASSAGPLAGTGAGEANRVSLTFTPAAGTLTLTVSGTVTNAQLETGAVRTSYIPTAGSTVTRAGDVASIIGAAFSSWYQQGEGTAYQDHDASLGVASRRIAVLHDNTTDNTIELIGSNSSGTAGNYFSVTTGGASQALLLSGPYAQGRQKSASAYRTNDFAYSRNGGNVLVDSSGSVPTSLTTLTIGLSAANVAAINSTIRRLIFWSSRLSNDTLQVLLLR